MRRTIVQNSINGVASPGKAIVRIVDSYLYEGLLINTLNSLTLAQIPLIRVFANDIEIQSFTGAALDTMQQYLGMQAYGSAGILYIPFCAPSAFERGEEVATGISVGVPMKDGSLIKSLRLEIDIAAGAASPQLQVYADVQDAIAGTKPTIPFVRKTNLDVGSAGIKNFYDVVDVRSAREAFVTAVFMKTTTLTQLVVQKDGMDFFDRTAAVNTRKQLNGRTRVPQAGWFMFDTREKGFSDIPEFLDLTNAKTCLFKLNVTGVESIETYVCSIGPLY